MNLFRDFTWKDYDNICKYIYIYNHSISTSLIWVIFLFFRLSMNRRKKEESLRKRTERLSQNNNLFSIDPCLKNQYKKPSSDSVKADPSTEPCLINHDKKNHQVTVLRYSHRMFHNGWIHTLTIRVLRSKITQKIQLH